MQRMRVKALRRKLIPEPYDPNARDGDNDGIVQEGTAWERPAGTRFLKPNGKPFRSGAEANDRPSLFKLVDADDNEVDYTPTYDRDTTSRLGQTVGQRQRTVGEAPQPAPARRVIRRPLKQEKYNPYLEPNDEGILQEGTIWERPVGTYFLDRAGNRVKPWDNRRTRPILFDDSTNRQSDYVPTYERPDYVPPDDATTPKPVDKNKNLVFGYYTPGKKYDQTKVFQAAERRRSEIRDSFEGMVDDLSDEDLMKARKALKLLSSLDVDASRGDDDRILIRQAIVDHLTEDAVARLVETVNDRRKGPLYIAIPPSAVSAILRARRMKSQFETGTSNGLFSPERRRVIELELMSIPGDLPDGLRPIYGFQLNEDFEGDSPTQSNAAEHYGVVVFQLKQSVRERTTMTNADSLDYQTYPIPVDGDLPEDRILAAVGYNDYEIGDAINGAAYRFRQDVLDEDFADDLGYGWGIGYSEIQVHGGVDLRDIEEVIYPASKFALDVTDRERIIRELDRAGIDHREDF
jgi:hypothetical protein